MIDRFFGVLIIITLRKLPISAPIIKAIIYISDNAVPK